MSGQKWSKQEEEILKEMLKAGKSQDAILRVLKSRTINSLQKKAAEIGLSLDRPVEIDFDAYQKIMSTMEKPTCV